MGSVLWPGLPFYEYVNDVKYINNLAWLIQNHFRTRNIDVNEKITQYQYTLLHCVCVSKTKGLLKLLLSHFAGEIDIHAKTSQNETALHLAVSAGDKEAVECLLKLRVKPNIQRDYDGKTALHLACTKGSASLLKLLLKAPMIEVNATDNKNWTPLHHAVMENDYQLVKALLLHNANPNAKSNKDETPLHLATKLKSNKIIVELLEYGAIVNVKTCFGSTPIFLAVVSSNEYALRKFLEYGGEPFLSPYLRGNHLLHSALLYGNIRIFSLILKEAKNLEVKNANGLTPLQKAVQLENEEKVKLLLEHGANPNVIFKNGKKSLFFQSIEIGNIKITKLLLESKAKNDINIPNGNGVTPLKKAIQLNRLDYVDLLVSYNVNLNE